MSWINLQPKEHREVNHIGTRKRNLKEEGHLADLGTEEYGRLQFFLATWLSLLRSVPRGGNVIAWIIARPTVSETLPKSVKHSSMVLEIVGKLFENCFRFLVLKHNFVKLLRNTTNIKHLFNNTFTFYRTHNMTFRTQNNVFRTQDRIFRTLKHLFFK